MGRLIDLDTVEFVKVDGNKEFNHGVDCCINRLLEQPIIEAIPKDQYETRLKADMVAMLTELQLEVEELQGKYSPYYDEASQHTSEIIQQKIDTLKAEVSGDRRDGKTI